MRVIDWKKSLLSAMVAGGAVGIVATDAGADVFTLTGLDDTNVAVPTDHGSNSQVSLTWDADWDQYGGWPNDPGDGVYQHDNGAGTPHTILFAPMPGISVTISDFDSNVWAGGGDTGFTWEVRDGAGGAVLDSGSDTTLDGAVSNIIVGYTGNAGQALEFAIDQTSGVGSYYALDNITFTTAVPEPGSLGVCGLALGALAMRRKKRS